MKLLQQTFRCFIAKEYNFIHYNNSLLILSLIPKFKI